MAIVKEDEAALHGNGPDVAHTGSTFSIFWGGGSVSN